MIVPFENREERQRRLDGARRVECIRQFRLRWQQWQATDGSVHMLSADAARSFDGYASQMLEALRHVCQRNERDSAWISALYYDGISSVGTALRDLIDDASARHAVAQILQERVLRAELRFFSAMGAEHAGQAVGQQAK
jgi:hypothetical protein